MKKNRKSKNIVKNLGEFFSAIAFRNCTRSQSPACDTQMCNLSLLFHVFLCLYKEDQCNRLIRTAERERGMDALNSTKPDDQVVSPTRVLLHLSILSINIGFTLSYHFFYNFFTRGGRCVAHTYIL